jgi:photosystem II stability/assembly factor-like uncharacterized protein
MERVPLAAITLLALVLAARRAEAWGPPWRSRAAASRAQDHQAARHSTREIHVGNLAVTEIAGDQKWNHRAVFFPSTRVGYAVGYGGYLAKTVDGGRHWQTQDIGVSSPLFGLYFFDEQRGVAVGERGVVLRTVDGGETWERSSYPRSDEVRDVAFWDRRHGVAVGRGIGTTDDGGRTWRERSYTPVGVSVPPGFRTFLWKIAITGPRSAVVCALGGGLFHTQDRGASWEAIESEEVHHFYALSFPDRATGYAAGQGGMWKTVDGGKRWRPVPLGPREVYGLHFFDALHGIAVGRGMGPYRGPITETVRVTSDGGATWHASTTSIGPPMLNAIHFPTRQAGFAAGGDQILKVRPARAGRF